MPLKETQLSHKISFSPISKEKRQKKSSIALAYIILSLVKFQSTNLCCTAILMTGQHATVTDAFKKMTLHEEESSSLRWRSFHDINSLNKLQQGRNALLRNRPTRQKQARERISFFFYCVTTSWAHRVHVECTADVQLSQLCFLTSIFHSSVPILKLLFLLSTQQSQPRIFPWKKGL